MPAYRGDDPFADFQRDLDESSRLTNDPFGVEVDGLDDEDINFLKGNPFGKPTKAPAKPAKRKAKAKK